MSEGYFVYELLRELEKTAEPEERRKIKERIAANVGDPLTLAALIGDFTPEMREMLEPRAVEKQPTTIDTIDSFISKFGGDFPTGTDTLILEVDTPLEELITTPGAEPEKQKPAAPKEKRTKAAAPKGAKTQKEGAEELEKAKIALKNRNFAEALAIMEAYNLNNPKKSVYFADQIRFIRKMMESEKKK